MSSPSNQPRQLEGRVALVTGAGGGIGKGIAQVLAERGAAVCVVDIDAGAAEETSTELQKTGAQAVALEADVTDESSIAQAVRSAISEFGHIDICVPNAGVIATGGFEEREHHTAADWAVTSDVNVFGTVTTIDAVADHMKQRRSGSIVVISSQGGRAPRGASLSPGPPIFPYLVSKAAEIQLTHHLAIELGQYNINVNAVCPGTVWTPMWERIAGNRKSTDGSAADASPRELFEQVLAAKHPLSREQTPIDIGKAVAFLASDDAAQITGQALNVNGGAVLN